MSGQWEAETNLDLLTPDEMGGADARAIAGGVPGSVLMENAGRAVARAIARRWQPCRTLVLCGPGNNGGDGFVVARRLAQWGWSVRLARLAPPRAGGDAAAAAGRWHGPEVAFSPAEAARAELVVDAVFGAGLSRDLDPLVVETLRAAATVVAIDTPSGVDGATGLVRGFAPQARLTVTFFRRKPGHLLLPGRDLCGEVVVADIGLPASVLAGLGVQTFHNRPGLWRLRQGGADDHKYSRGDVTVLAGDVMTGAARLAAGAARRGGAGIVTLAAPTDAAAAIYRGGEPGLIVSTASLDILLQDRRRRVWVCGPGLGEAAARQALAKLLPAGRQVVADADAFSACAGNPAMLRGAAVITPHAGEFARVFGAPKHDRLSAARDAARLIGGVVLLKGSDTIVAAPDGRAAINDHAPAWLATAGSGDVLAGLVAAMLAGGLPPWEAAGAAAWLHGEAGFCAGAGLLAEDLLRVLPAAVAAATPGVFATGYRRDPG
jgi:hydroxyethylthiazole kinase-like uncharacterized protein yjeF